MSMHGLTNPPIKEVLNESQISTLGAQGNVFERLSMDAKAGPEKRRAIEQAELERKKVDPKTGQLLFKPRTGKSVCGRQLQVKNEGGVANYLYNKHSVKEDFQKRQRKTWEQARKDEIEV